MQTPRQGKPQKSAADLARRVPGMARWSQEAPDALLKRIDAEARRNDRSRNAEVRTLLADGLDARKAARAAEIATEKKDAGAP
jgi:hypothetical protein